MYYYLILALQGFCLYHCYTNRNNYYWFFVIIFLPVLGSIVYLFINVIQKSDVEKAQREIVHTLNPTKKIKDLEKRLSFSETFENRVALADAYLDHHDYDSAIKIYESSLTDTFKNDYYVLSKLQEVFFLKQDFKKSISIADSIKDYKDFKKSRANFLYAQALVHNGDLSEAEKQLLVFDAPYNYYEQRLELGKFYIETNEIGKAKEILAEVVKEGGNMSKQSLRVNKYFIKQAQELLQGL